MRLFTQSTRTQKIIAGALLLGAIALLVAGQKATYKVYDDDEIAAEFGVFTHNDVKDQDLVFDATFSGVLRRDGKLWSTYDREEGPKNTLCPT